MPTDDTLKVLPQFDEDVDPYHPRNVRAARERGVKYTPKYAQYVDRHGYPVRDQYGRPL